MFEERCHLLSAALFFVRFKNRREHRGGILAIRVNGACRCLKTLTQIVPIVSFQPARGISMHGFEMKRNKMGSLVLMSALRTKQSLECNIAESIRSKSSCRTRVRVPFH